MEEGTELVEGNRVVIASGDFVGDASRLSTTYDRLAEDVKPSDRLLIDDGLIGLKVVSVEDGDIVCEVLEGGPVDVLPAHRPSVRRATPAQRTSTRQRRATAAPGRRCRIGG